MEEDYWSIADIERELSLSANTSAGWLTRYTDYPPCDHSRDQPSGEGMAAGAAA
jgi:hypothetical protein